MNKLFVDFETSGLYASTHAPLTVSYAFNEGEIVTRRMRPHPGAVIDARAMQTNGITPTDLAAFDEPSEAYHAMIQDFKDYGLNKNNRAFFIAYNAHFDESFMRAWMKRMDDAYRFVNTFIWPVICVGQLSVLRVWKNRLPKHNLATIYEHTFNVALADAHTSYGDVAATRDLFNYYHG